MHSLMILISSAIDIYVWFLIAHIVLGWLYAFNVINPHNQFVNMVGRFLYNITEPLLQPIRNFMPNLGGIDLSPIVLILLLYFARNLMWEYGAPLLAG